MSLDIGLFVEMPTPTRDGREPDDTTYERQPLVLRRLFTLADAAIAGTGMMLYAYENAHTLVFRPATQRWPEAVIGFGLYDRATGELRTAEYVAVPMGVGRDEHVEIPQGAFRLELDELYSPIIAGADIVD